RRRPRLPRSPLRPSRSARRARRHLSKPHRRASGRRVRDRRGGRDDASWRSGETRSLAEGCGSCALLDEVWYEHDDHAADAGRARTGAVREEGEREIRFQL
ncbi:hypothetical protein LTR16_009376, partial [Cryomyces antarcticus]